MKRLRFQFMIVASGLIAFGARGQVLPTDLPTETKPLDIEVSAAVFRRQIEADWLQQVKALEAPQGPVTTKSDAQGACDGVKNGKYGFHTSQEPNPWWQVDLGQPTDIARVVVFNRLDYAPGLHNADPLRILTSDDGHQWTLRHDNQGRHFGGITGAPPLEVRFQDNAIRARFVRLQVPSTNPVFFHLDEVEIYGPESSAKNLALWNPAEQSSLSTWSTVKRPPIPESERVYPTMEFIARGRKLAAELQAAGVECDAAVWELDVLERRVQALPLNASEPERRSLYLETRWVVRRLAFANPLVTFDRLLFVKRFTQETYPDVCLNHMPWVSRPGGDLCILSGHGERNLFAALAAPDESAGAGPVATVRHLLNRALGPGHVHGMDLWWDADRVVFGYARARRDQPPEGWLDRARSYDLRRTEEPIHLFEVGIDGRNLRQLTAGEWSDLDPTYAPNGDIVFVSERCATALQCNEYNKDETSCNLYVMKPDGTGIRRLSANKDGDYLPHALDDGTIAYTRWEYQERSWAYIQSIWIVRPDGTGADAIFKQHFVNPWAMEDVRSIPDSRKLVAIATGHHTLAVGPVVVVNHAAGVNEPKGIAIVTPGVHPPEGGMDGAPVPEGGVADGGGFYSTPWALSEKHFLVSYTYGPERDTNGYALYLIDVFGTKELVYRDPVISSFLPMPLRPRPRPPVYPDLTDASVDHAICVVNDVAYGVDGIAPERIRYLRVAEPIGWPYDIQLGGQRYGEDHGYTGPGAERKNLLNWTPVRILGDVPIERDGSAHFRVPADTAVYFQLLDENRMELRRMRSFISFQPGEVRGCVGCHESRAVAPLPGPVSLASLREPSVPLPPPWGDRPVSFLRDIQPVLDRHCVSCHSGLKPAGGLDFFSGLTSFDPKVPGYGHNRAYETIMEKRLVAISAVRAQDASITPPLAYGSHKSRLIAALAEKPHADEVNLNGEERLRLVMWIDANAPYHDRFVNKRLEHPAYDLASDAQLAGRLAEAQAKRCAPCHEVEAVSRLSWIDVRAPERSLFLEAALAREAGGTTRCQGTPYQSRSDADYQSVFLLVQSAVQHAWERPRRDLQSLDRPAFASRRRPR